ncbi:class I SAM-dependent methyltransferase [Gammaproteobacteria bacterium]|nr:class I SAM-dependent methyltransferase [Gammaproteobacteria bacterium]
MATFDNENINYRLLEAFPGKDLSKALVKKIIRKYLVKVGKRDAGYERAVNYNGLLVFDKPELHGEGMTIGQDYIRMLNVLGFTQVDRIFEFCSGPAYIGYSLLAHGFCKNLTLADINPEAIKCVRKTASYNNVEHLVNIYHSDIFESIPETEKFDLVVSNPPHFPPEMKMGNTDLGEENLKAYDKDWDLHRKFYSQIKNYMQPGGYVVMQENTQGGMDVETFREMVESGGGEIIDWIQSKDITGKSNPMYYIITKY